MKENGNNTRTSDYYIGLDVGTESIGWAVTDPDYKVPKFKGNAMWGVRLFDEASGAEERRGNRTARRRLARKKQRLLLLELLFENEMQKKDPLFFRRLKESALWQEDKTDISCKYALFNDPHYTDKDYLKEYPTVYHLRKELLHSTQPHDIRLVFLALHHLMKKRGHFLYDTESDEIFRTEDLLTELSTYISEQYGVVFEPNDLTGFAAAMQRNNLGITAKKKLLRERYGAFEILEEAALNPQTVCDALAGASVRISDLFCDDELKNAEVKSISLKNDLEENLPQLEDELGEKTELLLMLKEVFDNARLSQILGKHTFISDAKVELYEKNREDLRRLKRYVRENEPEQYWHIFSEKKEKLCNYAAYSRYKSVSGDVSCSQDDFCTFLKKTLPGLAKDVDCADLYTAIDNKTFLPRLSSTDNGLIPNQLHRMEVKKILENAQHYLPFLSLKDADGLTVAEKIISIFDFRIPYYVGPLNPKSPNAWVVRRDEKIYPWNFGAVVDTKKSAEGFIVQLIGRCTYTGDDVLPKDSLLYSEYTLLNEINPLTVNGKPVTTEVKQKLIQDLFVESIRRVTKKGIKAYLVREGQIEPTDEIGGIDDEIKSKLKSLHDMKVILEKTGGDYDTVEEIIRRVLIFGDDKKMLRGWLKKAVPCLDENDRNYICRLKYSDWGRLSAKLLTGIVSADDFGQEKTVMDMLRHTNKNLMQILGSSYGFGTQAEAYRKEKCGSCDSLDRMLDDMYISPAVRRSVRQTLKIVDEIVDIRKSAPKKIFIEVARGTKEDLRGQRSKSRKTALLELYASCREQSRELYDQLQGEAEDCLRSDKLFLYYAQFGKCMYSGEPIDVSELEDRNRYDIDHIFPRSRVKDDSIDNRVLVKAEFNRIKTNRYPVPAEWREKMRPFWEMLRKANMISDKKYQRLIRTEPLTAEELSAFVARQLVETQQSTKAIATLMKELYPETDLVYSKAGNVSEFRQKYELVKCRDVNDLHHAKDAYLNIVVGNAYYTKFTEKFFRKIETEEYSLNHVFDYDIPGAWDAGKTAETVIRQMQKNNILFTRMPHEAVGALFDLQLKPAGNGQLEVKKGLPIERYGGYNKVSGAYFFVVEHTEKKKRIRTVETVYIYRKAMYEKDPIAYCTQVLELIDPVIIAPKLLFDGVLEFNQSRLCISGRTGSNYVFKHSYQLAIDPETERYIKKIAKYVERCRERKTELAITTYDGITREENNRLYDWYAEKLNKVVYLRLFRNMLADMEKSRTVFESMSVYQQCCLLLQILKAFKCDRQCPDFSDLCGKKSVGIISYNKNISNCKSAYLVNQSVTGLYETRVDLLK